MLSSPTILLTGASSGIGESLVTALTKKYPTINLILTSRNFKKLSALRRSHQNPYNRISVFKCDVTNKKSVQSLIKQVYRRHKKIEVFILNAGVSMWQLFKDLRDVDVLEEVMRTNYLGVVYPLHFAYPHLLKQRSKVIVVSSAQSFIPLPFHSGYVASRYAVHGFLDSLRQELKINDQHHLTISEIMLGWVRGTSLRKNALGDKDRGGNKKIVARKKKQRSSNPSSKKNIFTVDLAECVQLIVDSIERKKQVIYFPKVIAWIPWVKLFFPRILYYIIRRVTSKEKLVK